MNRPQVRSRAGAGFSLLEILVALAIVSIGLLAALRATGVGTDGVGEYRNRVLALWLAQNIVAERTALKEWPAPDVNSREETFAGRSFVVKEEVKATPNPHFRRLDVSVAAREDPARALQHSAVFLVNY